MKNLLITGGAGYVGSHTVLFFLKQGYKIFIFDSYVNSFSKSIKRIESICFKEEIIIDNSLYSFVGDIRNESNLRKVFSFAKSIGLEIDGVIHFAGLKSVHDSVNDPLSYWDVNVNGTLNLLKIMEEYNCRTLVFSSSATIYGAINKFHIKETDPVMPINPYGNTKATIEKILENLSNLKRNSWRIINLRYFNPLGAHYSGLLGENPKGKPNNIIPILLKVALAKFEKFYIYGNDWPTSDGTCIRDYIHVEDVAEGHYAAIKKLTKQKEFFRNINIGTGIGTSVLDLLFTFQKVNDIKINYEFSKRREGDCSILVADNKLALSELDWHPSRSIQDMCFDSYRWAINNKKEF